MSEIPGSFQVLRVPFRFDDDPARRKLRPAVVLSVAPNGKSAVLLKVTSSPPRDEYPGEVALQDWAEAGLPHASTVRCAKPEGFPIGHLLDEEPYGSLTVRDAQAVYAGVLMALRAASREDR